MYATKKLGYSAAFWACLAMVLPLPTRAAEEVAAGETSPQAVSTVDVSLQVGGTLQGRWVGVQGDTHVGRSVSLFQRGRQLATAPLDADGRFSFAGLRGGTYQVAVGPHVYMTRCWAPGTAPPHATGQLECRPQIVTRGQANPMSAGLANPWVIAGIAVAAIVIPIALSENRDDRSASGN